MYYNILVPYDGSEHAQHALQAAFGVAGRDKPADVTVLNVTDEIEFDNSTFQVAARMAGVPAISEETAESVREKYFSEHRDHVEKQIEEFFESVPDNIDVHITVLGGRPQEVIHEYAEENDFDCIVMGRRGLGAIRGALGSVSYSVLRSTELPVLIVK